MKRLFLLLGFTVLGLLTASAQTKISKAQMYEDFDQFVDIVQKYDAQIGVRKAVTGYDVMEHVLALRPQIDTITNDTSFLRLMRNATNALLDVHTSHAMIMPLWEMVRKAFANTISDVDTLKAYQSARMLFCSTQPPTFGLRANALLYHDENYYTVGKLRLWNCTHSLPIKNMILTKVGEMSVDSFLYRNIPMQHGSTVRWDETHRKYYSTHLVMPKREVTFKNIRSGKEMVVDLAQYNGYLPQYSKGLYMPADFSQKSVLYFSREKILYIRLYHMYNGMQNEIIQYIQSALNGRTPEKIVLDVRKNSGLCDDVWMNVVQYLTGDTICMPLKAAIKASPELLAFCQKGDSSQWEPYSYLGEDFYALKDGVCLLKPAAKNCGYHGKFYVLQDRGTMSAAHSLSSLHRYCERFVTVGEPTGTIAGRGCGPTLFQLKHSGYTFFMEFDIDFTNVSQPADAYQDAVDVPVRCTLEEAERNAMFNDYWSKSFLRKKDPYFRKVLELE